MPSNPRIAVVDDHRLFSSGFSLVLAAPPINGEVMVFDSPDRLLDRRAAPERWDLIALDMFIPGHDPRDTIAAVVRRWPDAAVVVVSGSRSPSDEAACLDAGARAFLSKSVDPDQLRSRLCALLGIGGAPAAGTPAPSQREAFEEAASAGGLSARQLEIVLLAAEGLSNKEIAGAIGVSPETVKTHMASAFQRLGARNRTAAIEAARRLGLL